MQPENEIGVMNMGIGATFSGARTMVASSGGGFALMEEAYSLAGMSESPIVAVIAQRGGPSSGIPTYTEQADMQFALNVGHGDFLRIVASPGSIEEAYYLSAELMKMAWKFQTPAILLTEKYISECSQSITLGLDLTSLAYNYKDGEMKIKKHEDAAVNEKGYKRYLNTEKGISPLKFPPSKELIMWNSYEHDELGVTTEDPEMITKMHNKRNRKVKSCTDYMKKIISVNIYGEEGPLIFTWGGSTMSVLEALDYGNIQAQVIQPVFLRPFPVWELKEFKYEEVIVVEKNVTGQLSTLLNDKANIKTKHLINRYDGRPFDPKQLANDIKEVI